MSDQAIELRAKIYVYDLNNCACEFGFKTDEGWEVNMVTSGQKGDIEKKYFPTLSVKVPPEMLGSVRIKLRHGINKVLDTTTARQQHCQYLVAFSPRQDAPLIR